MDAIRIGRSIRALRIRRGWRQLDLATASGLSRSVIGRIETGELARRSLGDVEAVCRALGADLDARVRWHGEHLDRLLDEAHAGIVDRFVRLLQALGWDTAVEVTFNVFGDRGSVDVLGWRSGRRALLISEIKSTIADAQGTLMPLDRKARLGVQIGRARGWHPATVSRVLVVRDGSTNRRRIEHLRATFQSELPVRGREFRAWLGAPHRPVAALVFFPDSPQKSLRRSPAGSERVNRPKGARRISQ